MMYNDILRYIIGFICIIYGYNFIKKRCVDIFIENTNFQFRFEGFFAVLLGVSVLIIGIIVLLFKNIVSKFFEYCCP
jgi:hypothetical protein